MGRRSDKRSNSTILWTCAIVFVVFSFLWLYHFQADMLAAVQHVLSDGKTSYQPLLGAVLITVLLQCLQFLAYSVFHLTNRGHAFTYFPSMFVLALISAVNTDLAQSYSWGFWWILIALVLIGWIGICIVVKYIQNVEPDRNTSVFLSRPMWINMLVLFLMMMGVAAVGNTNAVFHYRMRAETSLLQGDYEGALDAGWESLESDVHLQMIRMYAMAKRGELGERLFHYPIVGSSDVMLPTSGRAHFVRYPVDSLYRTFGAKPAHPMPPTTYLQLISNRDKIHNDSVLSSSASLAKDYLLCGLLIDRRLDDFVSMIQQYYAVNDSLDTNHLPKHYCEALTLYCHSRRHPILIYRNAVMEEDYRNLQELEHKYPDAIERQGKVEDMYGDTYWYYYTYQ